MLRLILTLTFIALLASCKTVPPQDCYTLERGTTEYRTCRALNGDKEFQFRLAMEYHLNGDLKKGRDWLHEAARNISGLKTIEHEVYRGIGVMQQVNMAQEKPQEGHKAALQMLATIYEQGIDVLPNQSRADAFRGRSVGYRVDIEELTDHYKVKTIRINTGAKSKAIKDEFVLMSFNVNKGI